MGARIGNSTGRAGGKEDGAYMNSTLGALSCPSVNVPYGSTVVFEVMSN